MTKTIETVKEIFYFYPERFGYYPDSIENVYLAGEFNDWGKDTHKLEPYKLIKDKSNKWVGVFEVPKGQGFYKFFLNKNTYAPEMSLMTYQTCSTPEWAKKAVWYQIMVDRFYKGDHSIETPSLIPWEAPPDHFNNFGGDLKGIQAKLDYFREFFGNLENKALYLNPLHLSLSSNHKYWPEDFEKIDPQFGTDEDLKNLVEALHKEGGRLILDLVYNHTGLNHFAFRDIVKNGNNSPYFHWYRGMPSLPHEKLEIPVLETYLEGKPQNVELENDPRHPDFDPSKESFIGVWSGKYKFPIFEPEKFKKASFDEIVNHQPYYRLISLYSKPNYNTWWGHFEIPELNTKNPNVRENLFKSVRKWIRLGVDGFRLDVPDCLVDAHDFWQEFRKQVREEAEIAERNPDDIYITGEIWTGAGITASFLYPNNEGRPKRFDTIMNYPVRENIFNFLSGQILQPAHDTVVKEGEISVPELDNNLNKNFCYLPWGTVQVQYNVFSSHDTRRLRTAITDDRKLKAALTMQFTLPGAPAIYYGDEIGMQGGSDPGSRAAMKWDVIEQISHHKREKDIFGLYKMLIQLRDNVPCIVDAPVLTVLADDNKKIYSYARYNNVSDCALVIAVRNGLEHELNLDVSNLPFENIVNWQNPVTGKSFANYGRNIIIKPEDLSDNFAMVLLPFEE